MANNVVHFVALPCTLIVLLVTSSIETLSLCGIPSTPIMYNLSCTTISSLAPTSS